MKALTESLAGGFGQDDALTAKTKSFLRPRDLPFRITNLMVTYKAGYKQ